MNLCQSHWDKLRDAIKARGLWQFVAASGEEAHARMKRELDGNKSLKDYDPLMSASMMIFSNAMNIVGLALMNPGDDGKPPCPICFLQASCPCGKPDCGQQFDAWVDKAADGALDHCKSVGMVAET